MDGKLVSIIIPTYNRADKIISCLDSVCNQTYKNLEIIVVDDCSTDNTKEVVLGYHDARIHYHCLEKNSGACIARNKGVELSKGDIIAFQDSDDVWHKEKLEKQLIFMFSGNYEFITCGFYRIKGNKREKIGFKQIGNNKIDIWCKLLNGNWVSTQTIVCYKYCFEKIGFDKNVKRFQDWDFALQATKFYRIGAMNQYLVDVYLQDDSITNTNKTYDSMMYILNKHKMDVDYNNRKMVAQYYKSLADAERLKSPLKAAKIYLKSLQADFNPRILIAEFLCLCGVIRLYDKKYR